MPGYVEESKLSDPNDGDDFPDEDGNGSPDYLEDQFNIMTTVLRSWVARQAGYSDTLKVVGGLVPVRWSIPEVLMMTQQGVVSGTPLAASEYQVQVKRRTPEGFRTA